jgi:hypothetical protein
MISKNKRMTKDRIWFNTIQAAFILNTTDRTIRTRAKNHLRFGRIISWVNLLASSSTEDVLGVVTISWNTAL